MLQEQVNEITTGWRDVINGFIAENKDNWERLEEKYSKECEDFDGILET